MARAFLLRTLLLEKGGGGVGWGGGIHQCTKCFCSTVSLTNRPFYSWKRKQTAVTNIFILSFTFRMRQHTSSEVALQWGLR